MIVSGPVPYDYTAAMRNRKLKRLSALVPHHDTNKSPKRTETSKTKDARKTNIIEKLKKKYGYHPGDRIDNTSIFSGSGGIPHKVTRPKPTKVELSESEIMEARLVSASHKAYKHQDLDRAQSYLDIDDSTSGWLIDKNLSNFDHLVMTKGSGSSKQMRVVARGTEWSRGPDLNDLRTDYEAIVGGMGNDPQTMQIKTVLKEALRNHNVTKSQTKLNGYSKSGAQMMHVGDAEGVETNLFNPLLGRDQINSKSSVKHRIITTTEDLASIASHIVDKDNWNVDRIRAIRGGRWNAWMQHRLRNFTQRGARQPSGLEENTRKTARLGLKYANYDTLHMMKTDIENGKTFTESMKSFGGMTEQDTHFGDLEDNEITRLTPRAAYQSPHVEHWERMGGKFTAMEHEHFNNTPKAHLPETTPVEEAMSGVPLHKMPDQEVDNFTSRSKLQREAVLEDTQDEINKTMEETTNVAESHATNAMDFVPTPVQASKGLIAGVVASKITGAMDPDNKMGEDVHNLATGAVASTLLGGTSAPLLTGAAVGYEAGARSTEAIDSGLEKLGVNKTAAQGIASVGGGAIGGTAAAATTTGVALASDVILGTEFGAMGGPLGMAVGAGVGAVIGGVGWLTHSIFHWW